MIAAQRCPHLRRVDSPHIAKKDRCEHREGENTALAKDKRTRVPVKARGMKALEESLLPKARVQGVPMYRVVFNIVNTTFGTGFFLYPKHFAHLGIPMGLTIMLGLLVFVSFSLHALTVAIVRSPPALTAYPETMAHLIPFPWVKRVVALFITVYLIGADSAYLALVADQSEALSVPLPRQASLLVVLAVAAPFTTFRDMSAFWLSSAFGCCVNMLVVIVLCQAAIAKISEDGVAPLGVGVMTAEDETDGGHHGGGGTSSSNLVLEVFTLCTTVVFSFQCHSDAFVPALRGLERLSVRRGDQVILWSFGVCTVIYAVFGVLGTLAWGREAHADPLSFNIGASVGATLCRYCVVLKVLVSYPLVLFAARLCVGHALLDDDITKPEHATLWNAFTAVFFCVTWLLAVTVPALDAISDLAAACAGTAQIFLWPGLLWVSMRYYRVGEEDEAGQHLQAALQQQASAVLPPPPSARLPRGHLVHVIIGGALILVGVLVAVFGVVGILRTEL
jgi:amino acid permease